MDRETHTIIFVSKKLSLSRNSIQKQMAKWHQKETSQQRRPKTWIYFHENWINRHIKMWSVYILKKVLQSFRYAPSQSACTPFWLCSLSYSLTALQFRKLPLHHGCHIIKLALGKMMRETLVCGFVSREDHAVEQNEVSPRGGLPFDAPRRCVFVLLCVGERESESQHFGDKASKGASCYAYLYGNKVMAILFEAACLSQSVVYIVSIWCRHNRAHSSTLWPPPALSPSTANLFFLHYTFQSAPRIPGVVGRGR